MDDSLFVLTGDRLVLSNATGMHSLTLACQCSTLYAFNIP